ncbi:MAG: hypothetical protein COV74_03190 [Candidatus Omnitrophica bacterium CG11_big_fil_rev_8_21_14_0_20_45_26]|uniref:Class I SAM-dependent methyltransferase n=1 Tax=Candidatus Abzuiibacterium crystallinum TaxID=1974748 RepID=A0A2H0LQY7_9BACT|nr:MAG: hypothetical protein COV74_03190 [Candidatus Omnitrophica bacterium CG11_big_fil_rev_8_21_14_0_20_45_26]PIW64680.1 MAG: class I SAM-dependent methyltransferase [Candidatus Omnitrophica bacterium CG12_big_fil_rev_8_21_14_0_65_45_16]
MTLKQHILNTPILGRLCLIPLRIKIMRSYIPVLNFKFLKWLLTSNELYNLTYHITPANKQNLIKMLADVTGRPLAEIQRFAAEVETDERLKTHLIKVRMTSAVRYASDPVPRFGRRVAWYILTRVLKPRVVVETGVDKGLSACLITAALFNNSQEGFLGRYYGTEIDRSGGYLLTGPYAQFGEVLYGDSIELLRQFKLPIDLFIHDSHHAAEYEREEYKTIQAQLRSCSILVSDNANQTEELLKFSKELNKKFIKWDEEPLDHWYAGDSLGIAY